MHEVIFNYQDFNNDLNLIIAAIEASLTTVVVKLELERVKNFRARGRALGIGLELGSGSSKYGFELVRLWKFAIRPCVMANI